MQGVEILAERETGISLSNIAVPLAVELPGDVSAMLLQPRDVNTHVAYWNAGYSQLHRHEPAGPLKDELNRVMILEGLRSTHLKSRPLPLIDSGNGKSFGISRSDISCRYEKIGLRRQLGDTGSLEPPVDIPTERSSCPEARYTSCRDHQRP